MTQRLYDILARHEADLLREWIREQMKAIRSDLIREEELKQQSTEFLRLLLEALRSGEEVEISGAKFNEAAGAPIASRAAASAPPGSSTR